MVYVAPMRRIQLYMDEELDDALSAKAARLNCSRSFLVREAVRASLATEPHAPSDSVDCLVGTVDVDPDDDIDAVVYQLGG